MNKSHDHVNSG